MKSLPDRENGVQTSEPTFGSRASEILETIGDGFCAIDRDSRIVYVNSRAAEMWGSTPKKMTNGLFWDWSPKVIGTAAEKLLRRAIVSGSRADCETFSPIRGLWLWVRACPIPGGLTGIYWRDISDRKSAEGALHDSEERSASFPAATHLVCMNNVSSSKASLVPTVKTAGHRFFRSA
jgi:PAS domain S-box-containing protein